MISKPFGKYCLLVEENFSYNLAQYFLSKRKIYKGEAQKIYCEKYKKRKT